jgi:hypothetical protein
MLLMGEKSLQTAVYVLPSDTSARFVAERQLGGVQSPTTGTQTEDTPKGYPLFFDDDGG